MAMGPQSSQSGLVKGVEHMLQTYRDQWDRYLGRLGNHAGVQSQAGFIHRRDDCQCNWTLAEVIMDVVSKRQKELGLPEPWREEVALDGSETKMRHNYLKSIFAQ